MKDEKVNRYTEIMVGNLSAGLLKCDDGEYVEHDAYERLRVENAKLKEAITEYIIANATGNPGLVDEKFQGLVKVVAVDK